MNSAEPQVQEKVVLVNERDEEAGAMEKLEAHRQGVLHRAFSVFIFNNAGHLLMQRRADGKYHSGGLWSNSCCGHPRPGEEVKAAAVRRLAEELGIRTALSPAFVFRYRAEVGNALVEHELDHVFFGTHEGPVQPDGNEASEVAWVPMDALDRDLAASPGRYTTWLSLCWPQVLEHHRRRERR